jgi:hypothetical protein
MNVNMLDRDLLLALTAGAVECVEQSRIRAGEFVGLIQSLAPPSNDCSLIIARR